MNSATQLPQSSQSAQSGLPCSLPECTAKANTAGEQDRNQPGISAEVPTDLEWEDCGPGMIDMELLTRPEPILFYKHLILFEDFLHDNGVAQLRSVPSRETMGTGLLAGRVHATIQRAPMPELLPCCVCTSWP